MKKGERRTSVVHMTEGKTGRHLTAYSIPLILGNLFQLTYNTVDSVIVGRFIGKEASATVGTVGPVMNTTILGISDICIGTSVLMSNFFGAKGEEMMRKEVATTAVLGFFFSLAVVVLGIMAAKPLLRALQVSEEILGISTVYLRIISLGVPSIYFYNTASAALKSVGDSKTPLKFPAFTSVLNGLLDIIFIGGFRFGIVCLAVTIVIVKAVSVALCIGYVYRRTPLPRLASSEFRIGRELLKRTLQYGGMTALQQSCQPVGKLLIQGAVNTMGVDVVAAFNVVTRVDDLAFTPEQSTSHGITTFVTQNDGAKKRERIGRGFRTGLMLEFGYWVLICAVTLILKGPIMSLFVGRGEEKIIEPGVHYLSLMAFFYLPPVFTNGMQGFFHGMGNMSTALVGAVVQTGLRVAFVYLLTPSMGIQGITYACATGWSVMPLVKTSYYFYFMKKKRQDAWSSWRFCVREGRFII